jgi:hypothetical protein
MLLSWNPFGILIRTYIHTYIDACMQKSLHTYSIVPIHVVSYTYQCKCIDTHRCPYKQTDRQADRFLWHFSRCKSDYCQVNCTNLVGLYRNS